jgi:hypothetical protein
MCLTRDKNIVRLLARSYLKMHYDVDIKVISCP